MAASLLQEKRQQGASLQRHCIENSKQIFREMKLRGLVPDYHIHVSVGIYKPLTDP